MTNGAQQSHAELGRAWKQFLVKKVNGTFEVLDYAEDFRKLWSDGFNPATPVLIVWSGMPETGDGADAPLAGHLTPLDWALAFSIKQLDRIGEDFRIHIVDLTGRDHDTWAMWMRHQLLVEMPWLSLHAPLIPNGKRYRKGYLPILRNKGLLVENGGNWALQSVGSAVTPGQQTRDALKGIARQWAASLVRSHDHHDLNNIMGPWAIAGTSPDFEERPRHAAFWQRLCWSGLLPRAGSPRRGNAEFREPVDILAVDDNIEEGWGLVLRFILGLSDTEPTDQMPRVLAKNENVTLYGAARPDFLAKYLEENPQRYYTTRCYDSPFAMHGKPWVSVLDIHLLSPQQERKWTAKLLDIARKIRDVDQSQLAWTGFSKEEVEAIDGWLCSDQSGGDSRGYDLALSLLPRLCALRWPAVPILVFSGTGRRKLIEALQDYGNIILAPPKPNLLGGDADGEAERFVDGWRAEFQTAKQLVEVQRKLIALTTENSPPITPQQHRHIVIALDESGQPNQPPTHIGGVFLVTEGGTDQEAKENSVNAQEALRRHGVLYYELPPYYFENRRVGETYSEDKIKVKGKNCRQAVESFHLEDQLSKLGALRIKIPKPNKADGGSQSYSDQRYLRGMSDILEIFLGEYLPSMGYDLDKTSISVWLPNKLSHDKDGGETIKYDLRLEVGTGRAETVGGPGSAYSVMLRAIGERSCFRKIQDSLTVLATRKIPYFEDAGRYSWATAWWCPRCKAINYPRNTFKWSYPACAFNIKKNGIKEDCGTQLLPSYNVLHHLADEFIGFKEFANGYPYDGDLSFDVNTNKETVSDFLVCVRLFDRHPCFDGFELAYKHGFFLRPIEEVKPGAVEHGIAARLIGELSKYAKTIKGTALLELARLPFDGLGRSNRAPPGQSPRKHTVTAR